MNLRVRGLPLSTLPRLVAARRPPRLSPERPRHVFLALCDHWEPMWGNPPRHVQHERVERWVRDYLPSVAGLADSRGQAPQHTFFYPAEEYEPAFLDRLAELCRQGAGQVEVHLHHDGDTSDRLRAKLERFTRQLADEHGLLERDSQGRVRYGFIHGNWALDNSRPDGRWCGVNDELTILRETGCYADFTMPSAPDPCQTRTINSIYYAVDDPLRPCSHDRGTRARVGAEPPADSLLLIQGPLACDWGRRKWGLVPRLENGDLQGHHPPTLERLDLWCRASVVVEGRPEWLFVKLHTHGAQEENAAMLLGPAMRRFHESLAQRAARDPLLRYYYVTARELAALVHQAEAGRIEPCFEEPALNPAGPQSAQAAP